MAAQFTGTKGRFALEELKCRARATSSLPVPLSPVINTLTGLLATRRIRSKTSCMALLRPMILEKLYLSDTSSRRRATSTRSRRSRSARSMEMINCSISKGLVM